MKDYTVKEIEERMSSIFGGNIEVTKYDNYVVVKIVQMYEYVDCSLSNLMKVSEFFGTQRINVDEYHFNGCDTCDYGSSYTKELYIKDEDAP